jgi:thiamine kinase-like enzyme
MNRAAKSLACFHRSTLPLPRGLEPNLRLEKYKKEALALAQILPNVKEALSSLVADLESVPSGLAQRPSTPMHGTFRIEELLLCEGRLGICDFDNCCLGDPLQDIASFLADLHFSGLTPVLQDQLAVAFYRAYQTHAGSDMPVNQLIWHYRIRLLRKVIWIYDKQLVRPGAERRILEIVSRAKHTPVFVTSRLNAEPCGSKRGRAEIEINKTPILPADVQEDGNGRY